MIMRSLLSCCFLFFCLIFLSLSGNEVTPVIKVFSNQEDSSWACARYLVDLIRTRQEAGKQTVLGLATGSSPILFYKAFKEIVKSENLDLSNVITFNLDEYCGLEGSDSHSYYAYMFTHLFDDLLWSPENSTGFRLENIHIPNGYAKKENNLTELELKKLREKFPKNKNQSDQNLTLQEELWILNERANTYDALIRELGPINFQILGIGVNGHIGFAEPSSDLDGRTMLVELSESTRASNALYFDDFIEQVPTHAITMGIGTILEAECIALLAFGERKSSTIEKALKTPISTQIPASALRKHTNVTFYLDNLASGDLMQHSVIRYYNGRVLRNHALLADDLWVRAGKVIAALPKADFQVDLQGLIVAPGYIDLQINGAFGIDFAAQADKVQQVAQLLPQYGVTAFLPTLVSCTKEQYTQLLPYLQPQQGGVYGSSILGIHLEGPYFATGKHGAHNQSLIRSEIEQDLQNFYGNLAGVKMVTLAPELPGGLATIKYLKSQNIIVSAGHTNASYEEAQAAMAAGVNMATHLFNAMPTLNHRHPGIIAAVLTNDAMFYSIIADHIHVKPAILEIAWRSNPKGLCLITDAMQALGQSHGAYCLGTMRVDVGANGAYIEGTQTIAGSVLSLDEAVRNFRKSTNCSIEEAIAAASLRPAQVLGIDNSKGQLEVGFDGDFIVLDDDLNVQATFVNGQLAWHASNLELVDYK